MIVVDTSAIFAVLYAEPKGAACIAALVSNELLISAATIAEARVVGARSGFTSALEEFLSRLVFEVVPVDLNVAIAVGRAYERWDKGLHPAKLNCGDCFPYCLAKERDCPLLFIGNDFSQTDVVPALQ